MKIEILEIINYCKEAAKLNKELADKCITSTGKGESDTSSLGGAAYFLQQVRIYEYDIPNMLKEITNSDNVDEALRDDILDEPIEILVLPTRAYNCLKRQNITTVRDLTELYLHEIENIRNLGSMHIKQVINIIHKRGLKFKGEE